MCLTKITYSTLHPAHPLLARRLIELAQLHKPIMGLFRKKIFKIASGTCDILNYVVTPSDHQCTNDGGHFILLANQ